MAKCNRCGKRGLFLKLDSNGLCSSCSTIVAEEKILAEVQQNKLESEEREQSRRELEDKIRAEMQQEMEILRKHNCKNAKSPMYDLNSIDGIDAIPIKAFDYNPNDGKQYAFNSIEYILQRKATEHKKNGRMDLAIACLRKSNQIMPLAKMMYTQDDYMRLVKYLRLDKQFEAADIAEKEILGEKSEVSRKAVHEQVINKQLQNAKSMKTDLVCVTCNCYHCGECAKYIGRVYSVSGRDERFPKLPDYVIDNAQHCGMGLHPFVYGVNFLRDPYTQESICDDNVIKISNRPYEDNRPQKWIDGYEHLLDITRQENLDKANSEQARLEYEKIAVLLPDIVPKSQGAYTRMKKSNSANFQKLKEKAISAGIEIKDFDNSEV